MRALAGRRPGRDALLLLLVLALALIFFVDQANLQLASDDLVWLQGGAPTVFDQYRQVPRLVFVSLHAIFGPNAVAALTLIFLLHAFNTLLIYRLGRRWLADRSAALVAAAVFAVNPLTLNTLTWISCLSYVLGTSFALLALLAFDHSSNQAWAGSQSSRGVLWALATLLCFGAGLFCSHEIFFLPVVFGVRGWFRGKLKLGAVLGIVGLALALVVNALVYDFGRYGVESARLFSLDFALAYASSALSSGLALALAYPLSFFTHPLDFLRACFAEPARWGLTVLLLALGLWLREKDRRWRLYLSLSLALSFAALITPYLIRLYLTPDSVNYDIAYILSGRVFYLPFTVVALALGDLAARLLSPLRGRRWAWSLLLVPLAACVHALWLYDRSDFLGLSVALEALPQPVAPRWNPYTTQHPLWFWLSVGAVGLLAAGLWLGRRRADSEHET